jgi:hypothetical protein
LRDQCTGGFEPSISRDLGNMARPRSGRRALGALFAVLTIMFAGIAYAAFVARVWVIAFAAAALGVWMAGMAARGLRPR